MTRTTRGMLQTTAQLCLAFVLLGCQNSEGSFRLQFDWPNGQAPAGADSMYAWASLEHWPQGEASTGVTLSEAGPVPLGSGISLVFDNLSYGPERVVVVQIRGSDDEDGTILFYGVSQPFALRQGSRHEVTVPVPLLPGPGIDDAGQAIDPQIEISHPDAGANAGNRVPEAAVQLSFRVVNADAVTVANDPSFSLGPKTLPLDQLTPISGDRYAWPEDWDLNAGFVTALGDGTRSVYLRYENHFGLRSSVHQQTAFLDTSAPVLQLELNGQHFLADSTIRITVNVNEALAEGEPQVRVTGPGFDQLLTGPLDQGFSFVYLLPGDTLASDGDFEVSATATDRVGHTAGPEVRTFSLDGERPGLTAAPTIVAPAAHTDGAHWAAAGTTVSVSLPTSEALDPDQSRIRLGTAALTYNAQTELWERVLDGSEGSGVKTLRGEMVDLAGNATDLAAEMDAQGMLAPEVHFDFDPPRLTGASIVRQPFFAPAQDLGERKLWACSTDPITGQPVTVVLYIYADETLGESPAVSATDGTHVIDMSVTGQGQALVANLDMAAAAPPDGTYNFEVSWQDWLGNATVSPIDSPLLIVDEQPPGADALHMDAVVYHRKPQGDMANGCTRTFAISGEAGAVDTTAGDELTVIASLGDSTLPGDQIASTEVLADGSFVLSDLPSGDRPDLSLSLVSRAGARAEPQAVQRVAWTANLCHKRLDSMVENPHSFEAADWNHGSLAWADARQVAVTPDGVSVLPDPVISRAAAGRFSRLVASNPDGDYGHALAFDQARGVVVLVAGKSYTGEVWEWNGVSWSQIVPSDPEQDGNPIPRWQHRLAYDAGRRVTVLYGGQPGGDETWEWDGVSWAQRIPEDPEGDGDPGNRFQHAMAYDSARQVSVLFGGTSGDPNTWEWDGDSWALRIPSDPEGDGDPAGRFGHAMAYDPLRGVTVMFGGFEGIALSGQTWEWDGISWRLASTTGPGPRQLHSMVYDPRLGEVLLFGGDTTEPIMDGYEADVWAWDGANWTLLAPGGAEGPGPRRAHGAAFDSRRGRMVVFGGFNWNVATDVGLADTWEFAGQTASWTWLAPHADPVWPTGRHSFASAFDAARQRLVVFGGQQSDDESGPPLDELWEWDGRRWELKCSQALGCAGPGARYAAAMADLPGDGVLLFGGSDGSATNLPDTWIWDGNSWSLQPAGADDPPARRKSSMVFDSARGEVILFGGIPDSPSFQLTGVQDTWAWDTVSQSWGEVTPAGVPIEQRFDHAMAYDPVHGQVVLFGGVRSGNAHGDTWLWNGTTWIQPVIPDPEGDGDPPARMLHKMSWDPDREVVVLFGGTDVAGSFGDFLDDMWEWNGTSWAQRPLADPGGDGHPQPRVSHGLAYDGQRLIAFWGQFNELLDDQWFFSDGVDRRDPAAFTAEVGRGPVHLFRVNFASAQPGVGAVLQGVDVDWTAGASGISPADQQVHDGAALTVWDGGGWQSVAGPDAANQAAWDAPALLQATLDDPELLARLAADPDGTFHLAVQPIAPHSTLAQPATLQSDGVEVTVRYTRGQ